METIEPTEETFLIKGLLSRISVKTAWKSISCTVCTYYEVDRYRKISENGAKSLFPNMFANEE